MFKFYNANPRGRHVDDCTVRAISLATGASWDDTYQMLSDFARAQCIMPSEVEYIDEYLDRHFKKIYSNKDNKHLSLCKFIRENPKGTFLITMRGHITCCIDGCVYDTFDPRDRMIWGVYRVK